MKSVDSIMKNRTRKKIFIINLAGAAEGPKIEGIDCFSLIFYSCKNHFHFRRPCYHDSILMILNGYDCPVLIWTWNDFWLSFLQGIWNGIWSGIWSGIGI